MNGSTRQWQIQDFPDGVGEGGSAKLQGEGANLLFSKMFPENCMNMKEFGPRGGRVPGAPLDPPMHIHLLLNILETHLGLQLSTP